MLTTPFTELLGCRLPLQQAPMGGVTTEELVGATFLLPYGAEPAAVEAAAARARLVDFYYGDPDPALVARVHEGGALASWQAGSVAEARDPAVIGSRELRHPRRHSSADRGRDGLAVYHRRGHACLSPATSPQTLFSGA